MESKMFQHQALSHIAHFHTIQFLNRMQRKLGNGCGEGFLMAAAWVCWDEMK
jgi:hypothetical protein